jgi:hypothetical protein
VTLRGGLRSKSKRAALAARAHPLGPYASRFAYWSHAVQNESDPDRREVLIEFGQAEGWVGQNGEVLDPDATERDQLNASLRKAAGLAPRLRTLFGDRGSS